MGGGSLGMYSADNVTQIRNLVIVLWIFWGMPLGGGGGRD